MGLCPKTDDCYLLNGANLLPVLRRQIETYYCTRNYDKCARFEIMLVGGKVPPTLLPNRNMCYSCRPSD